MNIKKMREIRKKALLTQSDVANYLGVTTATISQYENGIRTPSITTLEQMADLFEVSVDYLIGRTENQTRSSWIKLTDKMPDIYIDMCGNMVSDSAIIWIEKDSEGGPFDWYDIGYLNAKCEAFEKFEYDQYPVWICSVRDVKAWMPLPEPYEEDEDDE